MRPRARPLREFNNSLTNRLPPEGRIALELVKPLPNPDVELDELERRTAVCGHWEYYRCRGNTVENPLTTACQAEIPGPEGVLAATVDGSARADACLGTRSGRVGLGDARQGDRGGRGSEGCGEVGAESRKSVGGLVASLAGNIGVAVRKADECRPLCMGIYRSDRSGISPIPESTES
jgi:hypothetical protein